MGRGSASFPTARVAVPGLWKQSDGAAQLRALRGSPCWREGGLSLEKRESGARACVRYITFRASSETKKDAWGREGDRPRGEATRAEEAAQGSSRGAWSSGGSFRRCPERQTGHPNAGRFAHGAAWTPSPGSEGQSVNWRCLSETWILL